jgi:DNA replicative helicase MCM subunit Mcm2 (Cdc46/Mcm family)
MITGVLIQRWKNPPQPGGRPYVELAFMANNVEVLNKREFSKTNQISQEKIQEYKIFWKKNNKIDGKRILVNSVCSNIYEKNEMKLGLLLSLIGGVSQKTDDSSAMKIRG